MCLEDGLEEEKIKMSKSLESAEDLLPIGAGKPPNLNVCRDPGNGSQKITMEMTLVVMNTSTTSIKDPHQRGDDSTGGRLSFVEWRKRD